MPTVGQGAPRSQEQSAHRGGFISSRWRRGRNLTLKIWRHPANAHHRLRAFLRVLRFFVSAILLRSRIKVPLGAHSEIWADRGFVSSFNVVIGNPPDWNEMQAWKRILGHDTLFVDVGANIGTYSLWAADLGSAVIAVEPAVDARQALRDNADLNGFELEVIPAALAEKPGVMRFINSMATMNHLVRKDEAGGVEVEVRTLDSVLGTRVADGVKIDVEGGEHFVLDGARQALAEGRLPVIQIEWNVMAEKMYGDSRERLADALIGYGYRFCRPDEHGIFQPAGIEVSRRDLFAILERST